MTADEQALAEAYRKGFEAALKQPAQNYHAPKVRYALAAGTFLAALGSAAVFALYAKGYKDAATTIGIVGALGGATIASAAVLLGHETPTLRL